MTVDRVGIIEFVSIIADTKARFVFRAPPLSYVSNIYYLPFGSVVWWCSIALVFLGTAIVFCTYKVKRKQNVSSGLTFSDPWMIAVGVVCGMEMELKAKYQSGKLSMVCMTKMRLNDNCISGIFVVYLLFGNDVHLHCVHSENHLAAAVDHQIH